MPDDAAPSGLPIAPDRPLDWTPSWHADVTVWPWAENEPKGYKRAAGMFDAAGQHIPHSHAYRYAHEPCTIPPEIDRTADIPFHFDGKWLFGGIFYPHFGHFLMESTARLWALEHVEGVEGFLFYPKIRLSHEFKPLKPYQPFFRKLGFQGVKLRMPQVPVTVSEITFPPPAIGIGPMIASRPEYRDFMRRRLGADVPPEGAPDIYIARTGLAAKRGRIVLEDHLADLMAAAGYHVYHPQHHDISAQIAQYRAARRIVSLDGSALHLAAMVVEPGTQIAILNRGPSENIEDYITQFRHFAGVDPTRIDAIIGCWHPSDRRFVKREAQAHFDFPAAGRALAEAGFLDQAAPWTDPPQAALDAAIAAMEQTFAAPLSYMDLS